MQIVTITALEAACCELGLLEAGRGRRKGSLATSCICLVVAEKSAGSQSPGGWTMIIQKGYYSLWSSRSSPLLEEHSYCQALPGTHGLPHSLLARGPLFAASLGSGCFCLAVCGSKVLPSSKQMGAFSSFHSSQLWSGDFGLTLFSVNSNLHIHLPSPWPPFSSL